MAEIDELASIKKLLQEIRNQGSANTPGTAGAPEAMSGEEVRRYKEDLKLAREELALLEKGTSAYNRKQKEVSTLIKRTRDAMKDARDEADILSLSMSTVSTAANALGNAVESLANKFADLVKDIFDSAKALDNVTQQFRASTGASAALTANIGDLNDRLRMYGVSTEEAATAVGAMFKGMTTFSRMSREQQAELGRTVALLAEVGMSAESSVKILEASTKTLGYSLGESEQLLLDLRGTAIALQVPIEQLAGDFASAENMVAALGRTGPDSFKKLAASAKATGVELQTIVGIAEQFDTFEGAAKAAQGLNAVLGGNFLDSITMVQEVDPANRFLMIRDAVMDAGHSVESLANSNNYYLKKSLAATLGLPVSDFMKMLSGDVEELTGQVENVSVSFSELAKDAFGMKGFDDILSNVVEGFKRPVSQIQEVTRKQFEFFTPMLGRFEKFNKDMIDKTAVFVEKNAKMVGTVGLLYNLANIDGVQQGLKIFGQMSSFTGTMLSNLFSLKGLLALMAGGVLYLIRDDLGDIKDAFMGPQGGIFNGLTAIFDAAKLRLGEFADMLDTKFGFNSEFLMRGLKVMGAWAVQAYRLFDLHFFGPMKDYILDDLFEDFNAAMGWIVPMVKGWFVKLGPIGSLLVGEPIHALKQQVEKLTFGLWKSVNPFADEDVAGKKAPTKEDRGKKRQAAYDQANTARQHAEVRFGATRGAQTIDEYTQGAITALTPTIDSMFESMNSAATSFMDSGKEWGEEALKVMKEGVAATTAAHANPQLSVYIGNEALDAKFMSVQSSYLSNLGAKALAGD